ncbi:hypothetical protein Sgly_1301 [Syntrophobotulus glycolicus DSM 8271]|uniref:Uncharacterized protein n=1 Tax=Syntrophobotulus glycolicus (strain DSM 8271 / FlGlyR) TaxID=645991 RepID=F0SVB1_SYNGF|nr:hypothetical protein [Syntrophobotulus glycolicus]ADY55611.1 hypothetical protein Sgly_1301 [Syntrophobotulus glycolicus DSM 8271]
MTNINPHLLFINACVNRETSRINRLAGELINLLKEKAGYSVTELVLEKENIQALNSETWENGWLFPTMANSRTRCSNTRIKYQKQIVL